MGPACCRICQSFALLALVVGPAWGQENSPAPFTQTDAAFGERNWPDSRARRTLPHEPVRANTPPADPADQLRALRRSAELMRTQGLDFEARLLTSRADMLEKQIQSKPQSPDDALLREVRQLRASIDDLRREVRQLRSELDARHVRPAPAHHPPSVYTPAPESGAAPDRPLELRFTVPPPEEMP